MPRPQRALEYLFDPARFMNDTAVMRMSTLARGAYMILFCQGWFMAEPGVFPDDDGILAMSARTDRETWKQVRHEVVMAFDTTSRPGFWVQKGTVETHESQKEWYENQIEHGRKGGLKRAYKQAFKRGLKGGFKGASRQGSTIREVEGREGKQLIEDEVKDSAVDSRTVSAADPPNGQVQTVRKRTWNVNGRELEHGQAITLTDGRRATFCEAAGITALVLVEDGNRMRQERVRVREIQP